jgi:hypothetical protein
LGLRSVTAQPLSLLVSLHHHSLPTPPPMEEILKFRLSSQKTDPVSESGKVLIMCVV